MSFLARFAKTTCLASHHAAAVAEYCSLTRPAGKAQLATTRLVIVDVETSGLSLSRDRPISIGAIGLCAGLVRFEDSFKVVLRQAHASPGHNIVLHGIDGTTQLAATHPSDALAAWLDFSRQSPLVGFHADFDRIMLARAIRGALGVEATNRWFDVAMLLPALFPAREAASLDEWTALFAIENRARHDALSDALATAQLLQVVLVEAARQGIRTLKALEQLEHDYRWLAQSMRR